MTLYHGSAISFEQFDLSFCLPGKDFGKGVYLTSNYDQAFKWAKKRGKGYVYVCEFDESVLDSSNILKIRALTEYDKEWLDFICSCRIYFEDTNDDLIYDRMADNNYKGLTRILDSYSKGDMSFGRAIKKIKWNSILNDQYCFKTEKALGFLTIADIKEV